MADDAGRIVAALNTVAKRVDHMEDSLSGRLDITREAIQKGTKDTLDELRSAQQVTARMEIAKLISELNAINPMIKEQSEILNQEVKRIAERQDRISKKYDSIGTELKNSYERDIRRLGAHIYDILENDYQRGIEQRYQRSHYGLLSQAVSRSAERRQLNIHEHLGRAHSQVGNFVAKRQTFRESLSQKLIRVNKDIANKRVAVPFWVIGVRNNNGTLSYNVVGPAKLRGLREGKCHYQFEGDKDFRAIESTITSNVEKIVRELPEKRKDVASEQVLSQSIESLGNQDNNGLSSSLKKLIQKKLLEKKPKVSC